MKTMVWHLVCAFTVCVGLPLAQSHAEDNPTQGASLFAKHCRGCHGSADQGSEPWYPNLRKVAGNQTPLALAEVILTGQFRRGGELNGHTIPVMPSWHALSDQEVAHLVNFILNTLRISPGVEYEVAHLVNFILNTWGDPQGATLTLEDVTALRHNPTTN